jgi:hypothetical protein
MGVRKDAGCAQPEGRSKMDPTNQSTVLVPFHSDQIEAIRREADGKVFVAVRRICSNLGIDPSGQLQKLKGYHWACVEEISTHDASGREQKLSVLPLDQLPMWLVKMAPGKIAPELRPKLEQYQTEAADVLRRHFLGEPKPQPTVPPGDPHLIALRALVAFREEQLAIQADYAGFKGQVWGEIEGVKATVGGLVATRDAATLALKELPRSDREAPPLKTRAKVNRLVRDYAFANSLDFDAVWNRVYMEFRDRHQFDAKVRAKNDGVRPLDVIEKAGLMEELFAVVSEVLV